MSYLGNTPTTQSFISGTDYFNGTGSQTAFTLSRTVASVNDIQAVVNNVVQVPNDAYTISGTTITFTSAPSAGTQNVYVRYLSTTTQAITPSQGTVSWSTLDSNIQQDLGVMYKNRIINGNMVIDQRNAGASVTPTGGAYTIDRWYSDPSGGFAWYSFQRNAGSVTPPVGFTNYLGITSTGANTPSSSQFSSLFQRIEGLNIADLGWGTANAKTVTLSFWVRSSLTGTFGGAINNGDSNRSYPYTFLIASANTWEYKTVAIPGDTSGTWNTDNTTGMTVNFNLGSGSNYQGTPNTWSGSWFKSATGAVNISATNGATFYLTGVQLEVGTQATAFSTAGGSYGAELALCQRYFEKSYPIETAPAENTASGESFKNGIWTGGEIYVTKTNFVVTKRATPTITYYRPTQSGTNARWAYFTGGWNTSTNTFTDFAGVNGFNPNLSASPPLTNQNAYLVQGGWVASAEL